MIDRGYLMLLCMCLGGCAGSLEQSRAVGVNERKAGAMAAPSGTPERCSTLDDRRQFAGMIGKGAAVLAGAAGLTAIPVDDPDQRDLRVGLAIGGAASAAVAAGAMFVAEAAGDSWSHECASR